MVLIGHRLVTPRSRLHEGQWRQEAGGGAIYLVEDEDDVAALQVGQPDNLAYTTQTTLSVDDTRSVIAALRAKFPVIHGPKNDDICYATVNRRGRGARTGDPVRPGAGGRLTEQFQFQPAGRTGAS